MFFAEERDPHLEGVGHGVSVDKTELEVAELAVLEFKIQGRFQVSGNGQGVVVWLVPPLVRRQCSMKQSLPLRLW